MSNFRILKVMFQHGMPFEQEVDLLLSRYQDDDGNNGVELSFFYHRVDDVKDTKDDSYEQYFLENIIFPSALLSLVFIENFNFQNATDYILENVFIPSK